MGDRTWVNVRVFKPHLQKFYEAAELDESWLQREDNGHGHPSLMIEDANYGLWSELENAAAANCVFEGEHGAGGEYGPHVFASDGGGVCFQMPCSHDSEPMIRCHRDGPVTEDVEDAKRYWLAHDRAQKLLSRAAVLADMEDSLNG